LVSEGHESPLTKPRFFSR